MNSQRFHDSLRLILLGAALLLSGITAKAQSVAGDAPTTDDITYFWIDYAMGTPGTVFTNTSTRTVEIFSNGATMSLDWTTGTYEFGEHVGEVHHLSPYIIQNPWSPTATGIRG